MILSKLSDGNKIISCDVYGCSVNSKFNPDASFFPLVTDSVRRLRWLKMMKREHLIGKIESQKQMNICSVHFGDNDVMMSAVGKVLREGADPSRHMPYSVATEEPQTDVEFDIKPHVVPTRRDLLPVRLIPSVDWSAATLHPYEQSTSLAEDDAAQALPGKAHATCQAGPAFTIDLQRKLLLKEEYERDAERLRHLQVEYETDHKEIFNLTCNTFLSDVLAELFKAKINNDKNYTVTYKMFCLNLYHTSPQAYRLISEDFNLPPIGKLKDVKLPMSTEINVNILEPLRIKVQSMTEMEKNCSVAVDIMRLKYNLLYSSKQDKIIGFHEINGLQSPVPARYAVVLIVKGILVNWTQPVAFSFLSATKCRESREEVSQWITKMLETLIAIGLKVRTFACTAKTKLLNEGIRRRVSVDRPYFFISGKKIYYIYDFPHMFRLLRNHFITHDFYYNIGAMSCVAKFGDVVELYEHDKKRKHRIADVLTDSHMNPSAQEKRDTKYASELLSKTVAAGIDALIGVYVMPRVAKDTVDFLTMMDDLHKIMDSSVLSPVTLGGVEIEISTLNHVMLFLQTLKLKNTTTGQEITTKLLFVKGLLITIRSVLLLFQELRAENFKHLLTGSLSLDATEKFFKKINTKSNKNINITSQRFVLKFRQSYFAHIMKTNNQNDISEAISECSRRLTYLSETKSSIEHVTSDPQPTTSNISCNNFNRNNDLFVDSVELGNSTNCRIDAKELQKMAKTSLEVSSYCFVHILLKKCMEYHNCNVLKYFMISYEITHNLIENDIVRMKSELISTDELFECVAHMEDKFREVFDSVRIGAGLVLSVYNLFKTDVFLSMYVPCPCFPKELFQMMFIQVRIYMTIYYNNEIFRTKDDDENRIFVISPI